MDAKPPGSAIRRDGSVACRRDPEGGIVGSSLAGRAEAESVPRVEFPNVRPHGAQLIGGEWSFGARLFFAGWHMFGGVLRKCAGLTRAEIDRSARARSEIQNSRCPGPPANQRTGRGPRRSPPRQGLLLVVARQSHSTQGQQRWSSATTALHASLSLRRPAAALKPSTASFRVCRAAATALCSSSAPELATLSQALASVDAHTMRCSDRAGTTLAPWHLDGCPLATIHSVWGLAVVPPCVVSQGRVGWPQRLRPTSMFQSCVWFPARESVEQSSGR